jgi:hypothetical protein
MAKMGMRSELPVPKCRELDFTGVISLNVASGARERVFHARQVRFMRGFIFRQVPDNQ